MAYPIRRGYFSEMLFPTWEIAQFFARDYGRCAMMRVVIFWPTEYRQKCQPGFVVDTFVEMFKMEIVEK